MNFGFYTDAKEDLKADTKKLASVADVRRFHFMHFKEAFHGPLRLIEMIF